MDFLLHLTSFFSLGLKVVNYETGKNSQSFHSRAAKEQSIKIAEAISRLWSAIFISSPLGAFIKKICKEKNRSSIPLFFRDENFKILLRNPLNMELDYTTINFHLLTFTYQLSSKKSAKNRSSIPLFLREFQKSCSEILQTWSLITPRLFHLLTFTY